MNRLPKDLKSVKKRIRAWRIVARIVMTAIITLTVSCFLIVVFLFVALVSVLPSRWGDGGRPPLPPATPCLKNARLDCINDIATRMINKSFSVRRPGDPLHPVSYHYQDCEVTILQEYDYNPYYVFCGRVRLSDVYIFGTTAQEFAPRDNTGIPPSWETDFFLVNRFNPSEANHYRGRDNMYFPEHYDRLHMNFGYEHPLP